VRRERLNPNDLDNQLRQSDNQKGKTMYRHVLNDVHHAIEGAS